MRRETGRKKIELTPIEERNERAQALLAQAEARALIANKDHKFFTDSIQQLQKNIGELRQLAESERATVSDIKQQKVSAEKETNEALSSHNKVKRELESEIAELNSQATSARERVEIEEGKLPPILKAISDARIELDSLNSDISSKKKEIEAMAQERLDRLQGIDNLIALAEEKLSNLNFSIDLAEKKLASLEESNDRNEKLRASLKEEIEELNSTVSTLKSGIEYLEEEKLIVQKQIEDGREELLRVIKISDQNAMESKRLEKLAASIEAQFGYLGLNKKVEYVRPDNKN